MSEINYLALAQNLGGTLTEIETPAFGGFGAARASIERFRLLRDSRDNRIPSDQFAELVAAFEKVRSGYEVDRVLVDPVLSKKFVRECRSRGIRAHVVEINRRIQNIRKNKSSGVTIKKSTRAAGIHVEPFFYAAELGFVQLSYRIDASVDDIVTDPEIGKQFTDLCKVIEPRGTPMEFKWAALGLRKMRAFNKSKSQKLLAVDPKDIENELEVIGSLDELPGKSLPEKGGLFTFAENRTKERQLYIGFGSNIRESVQPFADAKPFLALAGNFWQPNLRDITLRVAEIPKKWHGTTPRDLSFRLIQERHPLFNMPVEIKEPAEAA